MADRARLVAPARAGREVRGDVREDEGRGDDGRADDGRADDVCGDEGRGESVASERADFGPVAFTRDGLENFVRDALKGRATRAGLDANGAFFMDAVAASKERLGNLVADAAAFNFETSSKVRFRQSPGGISSARGPY